MIFQALDDKSECIGIYADGKLSFEDFPENLTKTWRYSASITDPAVEYAWIHAGGRNIKLRNTYLKLMRSPKTMSTSIASISFCTRYAIRGLILMVKIASTYFILR